RNKIGVRNRNTSPISHMNGKRNKGLFALCFAEVLERHISKNIASGFGIKLAAFAVCFLLPVTSQATPQDAAFQKIAKDYVEELLQMHPEYATELGDHRFDGQLTDYAPATRARALASDRQFRE